MLKHVCKQLLSLFQTVIALFCLIEVFFIAFLEYKVCLQMQTLPKALVQLMNFSQLFLALMFQHVCEFYTFIDGFFWWFFHIYYKKYFHIFKGGSILSKITMRMILETFLTLPLFVSVSNLVHIVIFLKTNRGTMLYKGVSGSEICAGLRCLMPKGRARCREREVWKPISVYF